jgi:hypothetical protein
MRFAAISPREASIFSCVCDTIVAPEPALPPVRETDAVEFFDGWLARSTRLNRTGLRILLYAAELAPRGLGLGGRLRELSSRERGRALEAAERASSPRVRQLVKALKGMAFLSYYGDDGVLHRLGYDPDERVRRGLQLRAEEGRP